MPMILRFGLLMETVSSCTAQWENIDVTRNYQYKISKEFLTRFDTLKM
jgi:hypothetical protein